LSNHNSDRKIIPYLSSNSCNAKRSRNSNETLETLGPTYDTDQEPFRSRLERANRRETNLGDEDGRAESLADAAVLVIHHEAEADDAGGAHLAVPARPVGHPHQRIRAHRAAVVHLGQTAEIGGRGGQEEGLGRERP
jgi:hypothetical protein